MDRKKLALEYRCSLGMGILRATSLTLAGIGALLSPKRKLSYDHLYIWGIYLSTSRKMGLGLVALRSLFSNGHTIHRPLYTLDKRDTAASPPPNLLFFHLMEQYLTTNLLSQVLFDIPMNCRKEQLCHYKSPCTITKLLLTGSAALLELCVDLLSWELDAFWRSALEFDSGLW